MTKVYNVADYAKDYNYIVARNCDGELWFWGAWNDIEAATRAANDIGGIVVENR